ncbi:hypothetical protein JB92DRAFT_2955356 [Gautieria morchelliformis]|nr:hypothetical protein JB92DRAFT_2955356 [Gautieria morchelliformis]
MLGFCFPATVLYLYFISLARTLLLLLMYILGSQYNLTEISHSRPRQWLATSHTIDCSIAWSAIFFPRFRFYLIVNDSL